MMKTRQQVFQLCQVLQKQGETPTVAKVYRLMGADVSYWHVVKAVMAFKADASQTNDQMQASETELPSTKAAFPSSNIIYQALKKHREQSDEQITLGIHQAIKSQIDAYLQQQFDTYDIQIKQLQTKNQHIEVQYYGLKGRYEALQQEYEALKESHYQLQQEQQQLKQQVKKTAPGVTSEQKPVTVKDYLTQLDGIQSEQAVAYDAKKGYLVVRAPGKHPVVKELRKGVSSFQLQAQYVEYDYQSKLWWIHGFTLATLRLFDRNKFVMSNEAAHILQVWQQG